MSSIERWKNGLDQNGYDGEILMNFSKAFNTINHDLLTAKLHAYGYDEWIFEASPKSYLTNHLQQK